MKPMNDIFSTLMTKQLDIMSEFNKSFAELAKMHMAGSNGEAYDGFADYKSQDDGYKGDEPEEIYEGDGVEEIAEYAMGDETIGQPMFKDESYDCEEGAYSTPMFDESDINLDDPELASGKVLGLPRGLHLLGYSYNKDYGRLYPIVNGMYRG